METLDEIAAATEELVMLQKMRRTPQDAAKFSSELAKVEAAFSKLADVRLQKQAKTRDLEQAELQKQVEKRVQKLLATITAPLQKKLNDLNAKLAKLEAMPAPSRISKMAVPQRGTELSDALFGEADLNSLIDDHGEEREAATLIKGLHRLGPRLHYDA